MVKEVVETQQKAEDEEEMEGPVNAKGESFVGHNGNKGHVGIEEGAEEAYAGKQEVRPSPSAPQNRDQGKAKQDDKSQKRRNDVC